MVTPVESYILDQKLIDNGEYLSALNSDFEKLPVEDFLRVRAKVAKVLDEFFVEDPAIPERVRKLKGTAIRSADDGQFKISALRKWLLSRIQAIEEILQRGANDVPSEFEERQQLEISKILNWKILDIFADGSGDKNLPDVLIAFVQQEGNFMNMVNFTTLMFNLGKLPMEVVEGNGEKFSALLSLLSEKIAASRGELNGQSIGNALYGLQRMDGNVVPRALFQTLAGKVSASSYEFKPQEIGNALYGLQRMDENVVPGELIQALAEKTLAIRQELDGQSIASGLYGLLNFDDEESLRLKNLLLQRISERSIRNDIDLEFLVQCLHLMKAKIPDWLKILYDNHVKNSLRNTPRFFSEKVVFDYLRSDRLTVRCNAYVDGFELDLFLPAYQLNIEIDGFYHGKKKFRDERRDAYLRDTHGMRILRIKLQENWRDKVDRALMFA